MAQKIELPKFKTWDLLKQITNHYHEEGEQAHEKGRKIAWCTALSPHEFLTAMDFHLVFPEHESAVRGALNTSVELCQIAEAKGYPADLCSYARTNIGRAFTDKVLPNDPPLPKPDLLITCNNGCVSFNKWFECLSKSLNIPLIFVDAPFIHDNADKDTIDRAQRYVTEQLKAMPSFLESFTGRRFDYDRLYEAISNTSKSIGSWLAGQRLGRNRPSPISCFDTYNLLLPLVCMRSRQEAIDFAEKLTGEIADRVKQGVAAIPGEKYRLYLDGPPPWFRTRQLSKKFLDHRACVVTGIYPVVFECFEALNSSRPIESLAESLVMQYSNRALEYRTDVMLRYIREYQLDGMIMQWPQTCKPVFVGHYDQIEMIQKKTGVPSVIIEGDMCDARLYNDAETEARIDAFIESLESKG